MENSAFGKCQKAQILILHIGCVEPTIITHLSLKCRSRDPYKASRFTVSERGIIRYEFSGRLKLTVRSPSLRISDVKGRPCLPYLWRPMTVLKVGDVVLILAENAAMEGVISNPNNALIAEIPSKWPYRCLHVFIWSPPPKKNVIFNDPWDGFRFFGGE